jgi:hypothetical protein
MKYITLEVLLFYLHRGGYILMRDNIVYDENRESTKYTCPYSIYVKVMDVDPLVSDKGTMVLAFPQYAQMRANELTILELIKSP